MLNVVRFDAAVLEKIFLKKFPLFEEIGIPVSQACFLPSLVEIALVLLEKSFKGKI